MMVEVEGPDEGAGMMTVRCGFCGWTPDMRCPHSDFCIDHEPLLQLYDLEKGEFVWT